MDEGEVSGMKFAVWEFIKVVVTAAIIVWFVRQFLFQSFYVKGTSMEPNIRDRDYLIISEVLYRFKDPSRGDIIVVRDKNNRAQFFIKRVIGLPGERIVIEDGRVLIYNDVNPEGWELHEAYLSTGEITSGQKTTILGNDEYFVMGDNRSASLDSRALGSFKRKDIIGQAWVRIWPLQKLGIIEHPSYPSSSSAEMPYQWSALDRRAKKVLRSPLG